MKLLILGATGRVGSFILQNALVFGHEAKVLVRSAQKIDILSDKVEVIEGNVLNKQDVLEAMRSCEGVISALNSGGCKTISNSMSFILRGMKEHGIRRIVTIGTAGILNSRQDPAKLRFQTSENRRTVTEAALDHLEAYRKMESSGLDWTVTCPTQLKSQPAIGTYRVMKDYLPEQGNQIAIQDTANFAFDEFFKENFMRSRVGISY